MANALQFEAVKVALKQDATGYVLTVKIHPDEVPEELLRDFVGARYMIAMARLNDDETPLLYKNKVQQAGMLCRDSRFHEWLVAEHFATKPTEREATEFLYQTCGITSRTELNGNRAAQNAFAEMVNEYETWRKEDEPF